MTLSEEQKELIRSLFNAGTHGVKWDSLIVGNTHYVNSLNELEQAFNDKNLRMIVCYEVSPYSNVQELLSASEMHGPYVKRSFGRYNLITSIYETGGNKWSCVLGGYDKGSLTPQEFLAECTWQDGTHCGKQGNDAFRWSCFSGVITNNLNIT